MSGDMINSDKICFPSGVVVNSRVPGGVAVNSPVLVVNSPVQA